MLIDNQFEGANPSSAEDVQMLAPDRAAIRPWSEDGDGNYKFCLNVKAVNDSPGPAPLALQIDWQDAGYMADRDYVLLGRDDQWRSIGGRVNGTVTMVHLTVPPGAWYVGLHPVYDLGMFEADCRWAAQAGFVQSVVGRSYLDRPIMALSAGPPGAPAIFVVSRFHPYETAGSYCVSGILEQLGADLAAGGPLTGQFRFVVVPMPNPDGVALGCPKRCRAGGPDLCHEGGDGSDPAGKALADLLAETAPRGYLDFHGWMHRDGDGLCYSHAEECKAWQAALAGEPAFDKRWKSSFRDWPLRPGDFYSRAHRLCRAVPLTLSMSWFGRTVPQMRTIGQKCLTALCGVLEE